MNKAWIVAIVIVPFTLLGIFMFHSRLAHDSNNPDGWMYSDKAAAAVRCATNLEKLRQAVEMVGLDSSPYACFMDQPVQGDPHLIARGPDQTVHLLEHRYVEHRKFLTCPSGGRYRVCVCGAYCSKHGFLPPARPSKPTFIQSDDGVFTHGGTTWFVGRHFILEIGANDLSFDSVDVSFSMRRDSYRQGERGVYFTKPNQLVFALDIGRKAAVTLQGTPFYARIRKAVAPFLQQR